MMLLLSFISLLLTFLVSNAAALELAPITNPAGSSTPTTSSKRDVSFTGDLDLQNFESFYWGAPAGNKLIYANLTVYFPEQYRFVTSMERFAGKLKSVQCAEDMMLEFNDDAAFEYAKDVWDWVNNDVNNSFIMVTNHEGCADDMERLPFVVSNMRYDEAQNKAFLTADLRDWEEIAHSYTLNVGNMPLTPAHRLLMERDLVPRGPDFAMDLTSGFDKNLFSATVGDWTTSVDAVVRTVGSLNVDFDIDVDWLKLKSAAMTIQPEDVAASIQLALSEKGTLTKAYSWQKTIITIPIEGISIAKVVKLGAFLDVDVGFTMDEWAGTATANLGARMALSNSAIVKVDLVNSKNNRFSGWTPTFTPIPLTLSAKVEGSAKVYVEPNVKLEASALGKGWSVGLNLQMPYIQADFAAMADSTGVCETKKTLGVDIDARIGVELSVSAATKGNEASPFWEEQLYSNEWPLLSKCLAFGPSNAREGEVADPNPPASKSRKMSSTKTTTTKSTKAKTSTSKKPKSTKATKTTDDATTKATKTTAKPTLTSTKTPAKPTTKSTLTNGDADETNEPTGSKTSKKSSTTEDEISGTPKSSGTKKPSATDSFSSKASHTSITPTTSPTSFSSTHSWTNSSRTRTGTDQSSGGTTDLSSTVGGTSSSDESTLLTSVSNSGSDTATPAPSGNDEIPISSETGASDAPSKSASSPITPPPLTLSSSPTPTPPPSSAPDDTCDSSGNGCKDCQDSLDMDAPTEEYFALEMEGNGLPNPISNATLAKRETRLYKWVCGEDTHEIFMAEYPTYASRVNKPSVITLSDWYQAADSTDCLNHKITTTSANPPSSSAGQKNWFNAEHIYEGNWIVNFFRYLHEEEKVSCPDMKALFFTAASTNNAGATWAQALMESLGSQANQDLLVFLRKNINGAKFRIFMDGNNIIDKTLFRNEKAHGKMTRIATVGRALDYLAQPQVGEILLGTASKVEDTLNAMAKAVSADARLNGTLKTLSADKALAKIHRSWLNSFMGERNAFATMQMVEWASLASEAYETETPGSPRATDASGKVLHSNPTLKFLQALQTNPPEGFNASRYAPLLH